MTLDRSTSWVEALLFAAYRAPHSNCPKFERCAVSLPDRKQEWSVRIYTNNYRGGSRSFCKGGA